MTERTYYVAKTAAGVAIETFSLRSQAVDWAKARGDLFPGWVIAKVTERMIVDTITIRRDRSQAEAAERDRRGVAA